MTTLTIEINSDRLQASLKKLADACADDSLDGTMRLIGQRLEVTTRERIYKGVTPEGNPFKPLSPVTLEIRRSKNRSGTQPLIDTGQLVQSGIHHYMDGAELVVAANRAGIHAVHGGTDRAGRGNKVRISGRRFMGVSNSDLDEIARIVRETLVKAMRGEA